MPQLSWATCVLAEEKIQRLSKKGGDVKQQGLRQPLNPLVHFCVGIPELNLGRNAVFASELRSDMRTRGRQGSGTGEV